MLQMLTAKKSVGIRSYSGPHFPVFGLNTGKCGPEQLRIRTLFTQWLCWIKSKSQANVAAIALSTINNRVNPVKHLRWNYWLKYLTVFNYLLFLKRASSQVFDRVLSTPLTPYFLFVRWGTEILKFIILKNTCWWRLSKRDFSTTVAD